MASMKPSFFYNPLFPTFYFGLHHPMKPFRIALVNELILAYGLDEHLNYYTPRDATFQDMSLYHTPDYVRFLKNITPETLSKFQDLAKRYNITEDCPVFSGLYDYCSMTVGASVSACAHLNHGMCNVALNWMGGFHHAKASEASGFCYMNDLVLGILELLKVHDRVLYVDIDIHAGDGVEEAFYTTNRVLTLSFHKYDTDFFPGTGNLFDNGADQGKGYAINFPLKDAIDDDTFIYIFGSVIKEVMCCYDPHAVVLQCGADSLAGDRLGVFNVTLKGHGECVKILHQYAQAKGIPLLLTGGGGYTARSAAKCWTYETSLVCNQVLSEQIPANQFYEYYGPDYSLLVPRINLPNQNTKQDIEQKLAHIRQKLREIQPANVCGGSSTLTSVMPASAEASTEMLRAKDRDYYGGRPLPEDEEGLGQHEKEGVSEGMRERARHSRDEPTVVVMGQSGFTDGTLRSEAGLDEN